jgi:hypothetical protein
MDLADPLAVAAGEVVVDRDDVDSPARESVQEGGEDGDERFPLSCAHLGDLTLVEDHASDELDVKGAEAQDAL